MNDNEKQKQRDAVTVGQIRARMVNRLEQQINELAGMIRCGYHGGLSKAQTFLKEPIAETLAQIQNLDSWASIETLFPEDRK